MVHGFGVLIAGSDSVSNIVQQNATVLLCASETFVASWVQLFVALSMHEHLEAC
jgi:hypothetical protein